MIDFELDVESALLFVRPEGALEERDFEALSEVVDPFIETGGGLRGLFIDAPSFPGWKDLGAMVAHFRFIRDHHKQIGKIAIVTDSKIGDFAEHLAGHFVSAEIKHFESSDVVAAQNWLMG
ncbi:MAG: STAS/SEC14 domain-containing protein [Rhodopirellula sp. JB044]|uniref:STAS/SEC14 domain-containing protein n=1 Tax=Rhodopirellula sp. JB044 TaxID=3342844 RepID=UPI00370BFF41